ncbi:hypothetical protein [Sporosarcina sp. NPDC096371]
MNPDHKIVIKHLKEQDNTIVLTSHNHQGIEQLGEVVYIIDGGKL